MTHESSETTDEIDSPLLLLKRCQRVRRSLILKIHVSFDMFCRDIVPLLGAGSRIILPAMKREWHGDHADFAVKELQDLEALYRQIEQLLRSYQAIVSATPNSDADIVNHAANDSANRDGHY